MQVRVGRLQPKKSSQTQSGKNEEAKKKTMTNLIEIPHTYAEKPAAPKFYNHKKRKRL